MANIKRQKKVKKFILTYKLDDGQRQFPKYPRSS